MIPFGSNSVTLSMQIDVVENVREFIIIIIILYCTTLAKRRLLRRVRVKNRGGSVRGCVHVRGCVCVCASAYAYVWVHLYAR